MPDDDRESHPRTEAFVPDFSDDTGSQPVPVVSEPEAPAPETAPKEDAEREGATEAGGAPVQPVAVPGRYQYLKWWQLVLVLLGVWSVAAVVGLGLFYWWYHTIHKAPAVFAVLVYVVLCVVGAVMLAMHGRPLISALSIAVMSGPLASVVAAAPLYGYYYCARTGHCLIGVIPY